MITNTKTNERNIQDKKFHFWQYFAPYKGTITFMLLLNVMFVSFTIFETLFFAEIIENITEKAFYLAIKQFVILGCEKIIRIWLAHLYNVIWYKFQVKVTKSMSFDVIQESFIVSSKAYTDHNSANFIKRIDQDPYTIFNNLSNFVDTVCMLISSSVVIIYICYISWQVGLILLVTVIICAIIETYRKRKVKAMNKEFFKRNEKLSSLMQEVVRSERDIKSLNLEQKLKENVENTFDYAQNYSVEVNIYNNRLWGFRETVSRFMSFLAPIVAVIFMNKGLMTIASFIIINNNRGYMFDLMVAYENLTRYITDIKLAVERISELYEDDEYELEKFGSTSKKHIKGKIEFKNVEFNYIEYKQRDAKEILAEKRANKRKKIKAKVPTREIVGSNKVFENLSFEIEPNTTVAFVGKSGSGKSTILNLISKLYEVDGGRILIDGTDIKKLDKSTLRSSISLVNQFPYIFDMTIKENLLLAKPDATDEEIEQVIKDSALDEFIATLTNGVDTKVGESGIKLSGGQKQRLAIARALLKKSSIILFDESTSSLDNLAQNLIKKSIDNIKGKSTIVIVAHRLTTIKNVDKIFYLEEGEIVDVGSFDELYKRNKNFKTMFLAENI